MDDVNSGDDYTTVELREAESTTPNDGNLGCVSDNPSELSYCNWMYYARLYLTLTVKHNIVHTKTFRAHLVNKQSKCPMLNICFMYSIVGFFAIRLFGRPGHAGTSARKSAGRGQASSGQTAYAVARTGR